MANEIAIKALKHGKPVTTKWICENGGSPKSAAACAKNWVTSSIYECSVRYIDGVKHYHVTQVKKVYERSKDLELVKEIDRLINIEMLTIDQVCDKTGAAKSTINRLISKHDIRKPKDKAALDRKAISRKGYDTVKRKKAKKYGSIITAFKTNPACQLWGLALGFNMGAQQ
jgi:hypothetical protein